MIVVKINGIDRSDSVQTRTLSAEQALTSQVDTCRFRILKDGVDKTFVPANDDVVMVEDGGVNVFGGTIVRVTETVQGPSLLVYDVEAMSFERFLDRYLAAVAYENVTALFVLVSLLNDYVNVSKTIIASMESGETWTDEAGSTSVETDSFVYGEQALAFAPAAGAEVRARAENALDLTLFGDGYASGTDDLVTFFAKVSEPALLDTLRIRLGKETGGTYTNYFEKTVDTSAFVAGWNQVKIAKDDFTSVGSPTWDDINSEQFQVIAEASGGVEVIIDDVRLVRSDAFTLRRALGAEVLMTYVRFNYEPVSEAIRQIAELLGYEWYVDYERDVRFFPPTSESAPFDIEDDNGMAAFGSLSIKTDISNIRNVIYVRGGNELGTAQDEDLSPQANGTNLIFNLNYRYQGLTITVNATPITIGVDFIDDPSGFDALYNFEEKAVRFAVAPAGGDAVIANGQPYVPIVMKKRDPASIAEHGVFEHSIEDRTIQTREAARRRGQADLTTYRSELVEGEFVTYQSGLRAGQRIRINSALRGLDEQFIISRLSLSMVDPENPRYRATLVSTRTFGIIEFLVGLLRKDAKALEIGDDEIIDLVESFPETIGAGEVVTVDAGVSFSETVGVGEASAAYLDDPPIWVAGPYHPTDLLTDRKRPMYADRDNLLP